jgi:CRISPR-associated protein Csd2
MTMKNSIKNRYDFLLVFDVKDGNPNGDPDAGNLPRIDAESGMGLVTDVCLKRKVRNYVQLAKTQPDGKSEKGFDIYVKEKAVLGQAHFKAFKDLGISTGEMSKEIPQSLHASIAELSLPDGLSVEEAESGEAQHLVVAADADKKAIQQWLKDEKPSKGITSLIKLAMKDAKPRKPTADETRRGREKMCEDFYDIRTFGAVMSLKSAPNCGQVRGPIQMTFARSVEPVVILEHSITRMAVATEAEAEKQSGDNRTMGRKNTIPYGLYVSRGFISAPLAAQTGFGEDDLNLFWKALCEMFEHDHSAARGMMSARKLIIFKHSDAMGSAPAHKLFDLVSIKRVKDEKNPEEKPARDFSDYKIEINRAAKPERVEIIDDKT